jgi:hypothetical protein
MSRFFGVPTAMASKSETALRARARRLERPGIPHIEKWITDGGYDARAFVLDQYGNPIVFKLSTQTGRKAMRKYLPTGQADDLLARWEPEESNDQKDSPWVLVAIALSMGAAVWASTRAFREVSGWARRNRKIYWERQPRGEREGGVIKMFDPHDVPKHYLPTFSSKRYSLGFHALKERPAFAEIIGRCIGIWSYVDNEVGGLFGVLLGTNSAPAHRVFLVLRRLSNQRKALDAAAEGRLSSNERALYLALMKEYKELEAQRNMFAHSCFGICPDDDDLLFVINIQHHVIWQADIIPKHLNGIFPEDPHQGLKEEMYVYTAKELETIYLRMENFWSDMFNFNGYLRNRENELRCAEFKTLLSSRGLVT